MATRLASRPALYRAGRIFTVTLGLSVSGLIVGGAAASLALLIVAVLSGASLSPNSLFEFDVAATVGAVLGSVLAPLAAWALLRRVPLGRAILVLAAGTIVGGVLGWFGRGDDILGAVALAVVGFAVSAVGLSRNIRSQ